MSNIPLHRATKFLTCSTLFTCLFAVQILAQENVDSMEAEPLETDRTQANETTVEIPDSGDAANEEDEMIFLMDDFVVSAEDDQGYYSANTLAGTRTNELTKNIPMTISTVNQEMLQDFNMSTLDQLGTFVPSIESEGSSFSNQEIRFRGFLTRSQLFEFMPRYSPLDYYNVDRADIIRGANSLIYGQADPGGKINIISKTANTSKNHEKYSLDLGNKDYSKVTLDVNHVLSDQAALRIMATNRTEEFNQQYKSYDFKGATLESLFRINNGKTQFRLHAEVLDVMRGHADQAFKDNSGINGLSGMPQNIVADSRVADLMSDDFVDYVANYNSSDPATAIRSIYPNNLYIPASEAGNPPDDRDGALVPDRFSGTTLEEQRQSIRDFYDGITPKNTGTAQGPDAYRETKAAYFIGDITHRFTDTLELKVALGMEFSETDSRIRTGSNVLKSSLGYGKGVNIPVLAGDPSYDELFAFVSDSSNYGKTSTYDKIEYGAYGDISGLRALSDTDFQNAINNSVKTWMVSGMSTDDPSIDTNSNGTVDNNERAAQVAFIAQEVYNRLSPYRVGESNAADTNFAFQQALQQAQGDLNQTLPNGITERGFVGWAVDFLYSTVPTSEPIDDKGDLDPNNDEVNPANDGQIGEVTGIYLEPAWEEWSNKDYNKSIRSTLSYEPDFKFIPGKQQFLFGLDFDRRNGGQTKYAQFQDGVMAGLNGVLLSQEAAKDYIYLDEFISGEADAALAYDETQQGFTYDGVSSNNPNSALVRDGKLAGNQNNQTSWHKTYEAETEVDTLGSWLAASGSYMDGRIRTLLGARIDYIKVTTDLTEYKASGSNVAIKDGQPLYNDSTLDYVEFSPSVGALFWITEELGIFSNYAESVISPTGFSYDVFGEITPPETGSGIEIGLKYSSKDGKINAQLTGFQIDKKNEQRNNVTWPQLKAMFPRVSSGNSDDPNNPNVIEENSGIWRENFDNEGNVSSYSFDPVGNRVADEEARSNGVELDLYYNPNKNISIFMGYAYLDTTVLKSSLDPLEDLTVPGTAHHSANAQIRYTFFDGPLKGWFVGGNQKYRSAALLNTYFADQDKDGEEDFYGIDQDGDGTYEIPAQQFALRLEDNLQTDFFVGWGGKLGNGRNAPYGRVQLTLLNAFNAIDLISTGANNARYTESRSFRLSANISF